MRAVAAALDTSAGSLYRYLSSRDDLLDLMTDRVVGELRPYPEPTATGWTRCCGSPASNSRCTGGTGGCSTSCTGRPASARKPGWFDYCLRILDPVRCA